MKQVEALVEASKEEVKSNAGASYWPTGRLFDSGNHHLLRLLKVYLRVALISNAEFVEGSEKLLRLTLDFSAVKTQCLLRYRSAYPDS
ncbi:hypothetical protein ACNKHX_13125 [Shigella flexneri]